MTEKSVTVKVAMPTVAMRVPSIAQKVALLCKLCTVSTRSSARPDSTFCNVLLNLTHYCTSRDRSFHRLSPALPAVSRSVGALTQRR